jgi:hypothetical protein
MTSKHTLEPEVPQITEALTAYKTDRWLKSVYITPKFLSDSDIAIEFLQAQKEAETLLRNFPKYLNDSQSYQLVNFLRRLENRRLRKLMPISAAYSVLNIATKVNRKCFRDYRALKKRDKPLANKG